MDVQIEVLSFLDLLDLDEEIIDTRLKTLMVKSYHTNKQLINAVQLLQYKNLINVQEDCDCDNDEEFNFIVQLLKNINEENIEYICKITYIVLCLNNNDIVNKSQHLIQQLLINMDLSEYKSDGTTENELYTKIYLDLRVCESVLDAIIKSNERLSLLFLEIPLENILNSTDEKLKVYFLMRFVPKFFIAVIGYNVLDRIWNYVIQLKSEHKQNSLKILSCLCEYYLPIPDLNNKIKYESDVISLYEFWDIILFGMMLDDSTIRKISVYLSKRAIDCVIASNKDINAYRDGCTVLKWNKSDSKRLKTMWDNYFILIDSLEEKQSNIVLPSLRLFESIDIGECWLNAAFNIGLKHDSTQVTLKCIEYRLKYKITNQYDAIIILKVFNDTNIYDTNYHALKTEMINLFSDNETFLEILKAIPAVNWSPVPFYYITDMLASLEFTVLCDISDIILNIMKVSCTNVVIRKAVYHNLSQFVNNCIENVSWKDIVNYYSVMQVYAYTENAQSSIFKKITLKNEEIYDFFNMLYKNTSNLELIFIYLSENEENLKYFIDFLNEKVFKINESVNRQYANKIECIDDVVFLIYLLSRTQCSETVLHKSIYTLFIGQNKMILQYILSLFSNDAILTIENCVNLLEKHNYEFQGKDLEEYLLQLYKTSILFLKDMPELDRAILSIFTIKMLTKSSVLMNKYHHEMLNLEEFLEIVSNLQLKGIQNQSVGRLRNIFYEKSCQIIYIFLEQGNDFKTINQIVHYIENVLECGGYGCLKWILKITNKIVKPIVDGKTRFNLTQFINKVWNEIEELKSSNQYSPCIAEFVELITQDALLEKPVYNNIVISYCNRIIEYGDIKTNPLYYLIRKLNLRRVTEYGQLVYILGDILLYCPVIRKDERITNNVALQILRDPTFGIEKNSHEIHFNFEIQYLSIRTLCSINDAETLNMIAKFMTNKIDENFRNKQRYHGNSQPHKIWQLTLQHILMVSLKCSGNLDWLVNWCLDLLVKLPHQPSVKICLEWLIALYIYVKKATLNEDILETFKIKKTPLTSQFFILYWLLKHKISNNMFTEKEYNFVLDFLLSHTMGQLFNIRLHAQYLSTILQGMTKISTKFDYTIAVIQKTFDDSYGDKSLAKLKVDYFVNEFDIIKNLNPYFIYYLLPKYCDNDLNESVDIDFVKDILKDVVDNLLIDDSFKDEWKFRDDTEKFIMNDYSDKENILEDVAALGTIQKKYIPWKNMSDINVYEVGKKMSSPSDLIVVASLINKLPNLGGMARTSEVFGVKTYVVGSLRHLQDRQFQGLSVSAERWINIEEVRPGSALKEYLLQKKSEGYSVIAAEQTSTSTKLQHFKFPKKTLLLLGHEKEGVPCDLLPIMDYCVEIPQQGYVRSLNVHVTAAIFVWEYARQNIL